MHVRSLGWGKFPGGGNVNPHQYFCLGSPMDRGAWWATIQGSGKRVRHDLMTKQQLFFTDEKIDPYV